MRLFLATTLGLLIASCANVLGGLEEGTARDGGSPDAAREAGDAAIPQCPSPWLADFAHRVSFDVDNREGTTVDDYSVRLGLATAALVRDGRMRADGADVRVTRADGQIVPHWLQGGLGSDATKLWTKVSLAPGSNRLFLYYGGSASEGTSALDATFADGIIANGRFDGGTSPWIAYPATDGGPSSLELASGRAVISLERPTGGAETTLGWCQSVLFPTGRTYRVVFDLDLVRLDSGELFVWVGGLRGTRVFVANVQGLQHSVETTDIAAGRTLLCFGAEVFAGPAQRISAEIRNVRVRISVPSEPRATLASAEESCPKR